MTNTPLSSWNDGACKSSIIDFVNDITQPTSDNYVTKSDRIAVFDNDGNLWSEKPMYFQFCFAMDRVKQLAPLHPEWKEEQPFKAVLDGDIDALLQQGEKGIAKLVMTTHAHMGNEEFDRLVREWVEVSKHPRFNKHYYELVYQPMLELIQYLKDNEFTVFIVSGGGVAFMRAWAEEVYGIPAHQIIGSNLGTVYTEGDDQIQILPELSHLTDKEGKVISIYRHIGRRPIFCSGNSDGDLAMMKYVASGEGPNFMLYLHHTDAEREWAYDKDSSVGKLDKGLDEAHAQGWSVIDMAKDWNVIYPFQLDQ